jgi:hypothetical protein
MVIMLRTYGKQKNLANQKQQMKKISVLIGMASALVAPNLFADFSATLSEVGQNYDGGGIFNAVTTDNGTFNTFCLSIETTFSPGTPYYYEISSTVAANDEPPALSYVTQGTAYIYNQFRQSMANYSGTANSTAVQAAIWYLQGDLVAANGVAAASSGSSGFYDPENLSDGTLNSILNGPNSYGANGFLGMVEANSGLTLAQLEANGNGAYDVEALNLYSSPVDSGLSQPQLTAVPEPTTLIAGAMLLLPFGASTLRSFRKNRAA